MNNKTSKTNYDEHMTEVMLQIYSESREEGLSNEVAVDRILEAFDEMGQPRTVKSVRSKLVREGVYVSDPKVSTRKTTEPTKKELRNLVAQFGMFTEDELDGAMPASKGFWIALLQLLEMHIEKNTDA